MTFMNVRKKGGCAIVPVARPYPLCVVVIVVVLLAVLGTKQS